MVNSALQTRKTSKTSDIFIKNQAKTLFSHRFLCQNFPTVNRSSRHAYRGFILVICTWGRSRKWWGIFILSERVQLQLVQNAFSSFQRILLQFLVINSNPPRKSTSICKKNHQNILKMKKVRATFWKNFEKKWDFWKFLKIFMIFSKIFEIENFRWDFQWKFSKKSKFSKNHEKAQKLENLIFSRKIFQTLL